MVKNKKQNKEKNNNKNRRKNSNMLDDLDATQYAME
jgi:hypothetical protein